MDKVVTLSLKVDGEYMAYAAMKHALMVIVEMEGQWDKGIADAIEEAEVALAMEERLGS